MRNLIYIAGPISKGPLDHNIRQANEAMIALMKAGFAPFNPMLSCFLGYPESKEPEVMPCGTTHEDWMGMDLPWVGVSNALLRLPGVSGGADKEVQHALSLGIPVYYSIDSLLEDFAPEAEPIAEPVQN